MRFGFWFCMLCMIPGLLIRIPVGGAGILLADFTLPLFACVFGLYMIIVKRTIPRYYFLFTGLSFAIFAFASWLLMAWSLDLKAQIISFSYIVRWVSLMIFGAAAGELYRSKPEIFFKGLWNIIAVILVVGFLQFFVIPDIGQFSTVGGFDPHIGRFLGTWMDPNFVAGLLAFFVPLMLGQWYSLMIKPSPGSTQVPLKQNPDCNINRIFLSFLIFLSFIALFLTFSRSGYLAAGLGIGLFFLFRDPKIVLIGIIVASIGIVANPRANQRATEFAGTLANVIFQETDEVDPTAMLRFESWDKTLALWKKYPTFGIGYNTYRYIASDEGLVDESYFSSGGSDSSLLTVLVTTGVVGFMIFMLWYFRIWFHHLRRFYKGKFTHYEISKIPYELHLGVWAGLSGLLLHSFFVNSLLFPLILMPVMAVVGILSD